MVALSKGIEKVKVHASTEYALMRGSEIDVVAENWGFAMSESGGWLKG